MLERLAIGFKALAIVLCIVVMTPLVQMMFRKLPLNDVRLVTMVSSSKESKNGINESDSHSNDNKPNSKKETLPPEIGQRSTKLEESGIFGRTPKPPPMALIGIAEPYAFLQTPDGQSGKVKQGETLRGVKVLRVGPNRVLVEHEGQTSELSIFSGIGSQSLMPEASN
ncbi:hypothetical protein OAM01_01015 [bacterium]|nr:hypothetical protein [bacterium]